MSWFRKDPLQIISFLSYGTSNHFYHRGRALEDETIDLDQKSLYNLILNTWKRFETDEIKNTKLKVTLPNNKVFYVQTDKDGYYKIEENIDGLELLINSEGWLNFEVSYSEPSIKRTIQNENKFPAELLIPKLDSDFAVISDIDDTILHTGVVSILKWRVLYNTFLKHAQNRIPLEGAADFYHLLHKGPSGNKANPIFYVSHSPWNLYRYLEFFLRTNNFPKGPILLRSFKTIFKKKSSTCKPDKQLEIENILKTYPDLPVILVGDSGEHDPDIYLKLVNTYPNRIKAVYLRSVDDKRKTKRVKDLLSNYKDTPVLLVNSSKEAIIHAKSHGLIK
ncbi:phosphatase domain-containing protein [uncultured Olleya sp.]|uniref:App1 family protein n=1 Tax=uncultured Olleya sp. TaxID=757243 RepID=UPI0025986EA0|nr:phosphatase domain-containing protein [uncultured Olleya sp.]